MSTVYNKVTIGSTTYIDLSQDTVADASHIRSGYVGHLNDGTQVTGSYSGSGGIDCPTFTVTMDSSWSTIQSVTCDKTYAECYDYHDNGILEAVLAITNGTNGAHYGSTGSYASNKMTYYADLQGSGVAIMKIEYASGGTITGTMMPIQFNDSTDMTVSGATVTAPAGYYSSSASASVASGTAGTPSATKGTVSNHSVSVTPSVTNTTGYITGGTKTGTAVTVTASELASGNKEITANGTNIDVVGYSTVSVAVPTGSSKNIQYSMGRYEVATSSYTATDLSITVSKAGTYKCYWVMDRNTTSGTNGSQLYNGDTALGSAHTTWSNTNNTRVQQCEETLTFAANATITVRARSRNTSYYCGVTNFVIVEQ